MQLRACAVVCTVRTWETRLTRWAPKRDGGVQCKCTFSMAGCFGPLTQIAPPSHAGAWFRCANITDNDSIEALDVSLRSQFISSVIYVPRAELLTVVKLRASKLNPNWERLWENPGLGQTTRRDQMISISWTEIRRIGPLELTHRTCIPPGIETKSSLLGYGGLSCRLRICEKKTDQSKKKKEIGAL